MVRVLNSLLIFEIIVGNHFYNSHKFYQDNDSIHNMWMFLSFVQGLFHKSAMTLLPFPKPVCM